MIQEGNILLVEVPEGSKNIELNDYDLGYPVLDWDIVGCYQCVNLEANHYELIGKGSELNPVQWMDVVDKFNNGCYRDYELSEYHYFDPCDDAAPFYLTATESGLSLLKKHNLDPNKTIVLKIKQ